MLERALCPDLGDMVSLRRGLIFGDILDTRKGIAADSQHKTAYIEC